MVEGRQQVRANFARLVADVPDLRAELLSAVEERDTVWMEWRMWGTRSDGTPMELVGVNIFELEDDRFARAGSTPTSRQHSVSPFDAIGASVRRGKRQRHGRDSKIEWCPPAPQALPVRLDVRRTARSNGYAAVASHFVIGGQAMSRGNRIALLGGAALLVAVSGTVLATRQPPVADKPAGVTQDGEDTPPTAEELAHAADRLRAHDITVDDAVLSDLATRYGLGGAVRVTAWAADPDDEATIESITAMRDGDGTEGSAMGWGRIAKELGSHPGIGSIMGNGGGHGRDNAPGQQDDEAP